MAVELFAAATTPAPIVFCDANFLIDLAVTAPTPNGPLLAGAYRANPQRLHRGREARAFVARYCALQTQFVSSPYVLEEIAHTLAAGALYGAVQRAKAAGQPTQPASRPPSATPDWKGLAAVNLGAYQQARSALLSVLNALWTEIAAMDVQFIVPRIGAGRDRTTGVTGEVAQAALDFHRAHDLLDLMDSFHVAMAVASGIRWVATSDAAFKSVNAINVFSGV